LVPESGWPLPPTRRSAPAAASRQALINLNSGVFNPELLVPHPSPTVSSIWGKARLRDRCDAVIAHEYHEGQGVSHSEAERRAADTEPRITDGARRILRAMAERER